MDYKSLTKKDIDKANKIFEEEQNKWDNLKPGLHFLIEETHGGWESEYFHHEIIDVDPLNRKLLAIDHSQSHKPEVFFNYLVNEYLTLREFNKKYTK